MQRPSKSTLLLLTASLFFTVGVSVEAWLWRSGFGDFPIYNVDEKIGYIPKPSQSGAFRDKYNWSFNEFSMRSGAFFATSPKDVLLLGDSLVFGSGINIEEKDRLGLQLQAAMPASNIWAIGAGSWAFLNELEYLTRNPSVVAGCEKVYWIVNWQDFGVRSRWRSDLVHPTSKPKILSVYLARKWLQSKGLIQVKPVDYPDLISNETVDAIKAAAKFLGNKVTFIWYPTKAEFVGDEIGIALANKAAFVQLCRELNLPILDLSQYSEWASDLYKDTIHPTAEGNRKIAQFITENS